ncbi:MAG: hypothetical protein WCP16_23885 [Pseudanabaena sp. ELA645]
MTHSKSDRLNGDRLNEIDCWCDRLEITTHSNSDRLYEISCWCDRHNLAIGEKTLAQYRYSLT